MDMDRKEKSDRSRPEQRCCKDTEKISQFKILTQCFSEAPKTMYQAEKETGIRIANICRFIDKMRKNGIIRKVYVGKCPMSHRQAGFYTSNQEYFKDDKQLSLFDILWKGGQQ